MNTSNQITNQKKISFIEFLLYLYIILIPVMRVPSLPLFKQKIQYSDIIFLVLAGVWIIHLMQNKIRFKSIPLGISLLVMLCMFLTSFINSQKRLESAIDFLGIFYLVCVYFVLVQVVTTEKIWWRIIKYWTIVSFLLSLTGIIAYISLVLFDKQTFMIQRFYDVNFAPNLSLRLISFFRNPNMLAAYLHTSIVFGFVWLGLPKNHLRGKIWICIMIFSFIIAVFLTKTRVNLGIALTVFLILTYFQLKNRIISVLKYFSFLWFILLFVLVLFTTIWWIFPVRVDINPEKDTAGIGFNLTHQMYFILHKAAFGMIADHPLSGVGMGMYNYRTAQYINWREAKKPFQMILPNLTEKDENLYKMGYDPHSTYFGWAAETGLLGLSGIMLFFSTLLYRLHRYSNYDNNRKYLYQCFFGGLLGFLLNGWYIDILTMRHFWFMLAMPLILTKFVNGKIAGGGK